MSHRQQQIMSSPSFLQMYTAVCDFFDQAEQKAETPRANLLKTAVIAITYPLISSVAFIGALVAKVLMSALRLILGFPLLGPLVMAMVGGYIHTVYRVPLLIRLGAVYCGETEDQIDIKKEVGDQAEEEFPFKKLVRPKYKLIEVLAPYYYQEKDPGKQTKYGAPKHYMTYWLGGLIHRYWLEEVFKLLFCMFAVLTFGAANMLATALAAAGGFLIASVMAPILSQWSDVVDIDYVGDFEHKESSSKNGKTRVALRSFQSYPQPAFKVDEVSDVKPNEPEEPFFPMEEEKTTSLRPPSPSPR
jgi:hypothetical protein